MGCAPSKIQDGAVAEGQPEAKANGQPDGATPAAANERKPFLLLNYCLTYLQILCTFRNTEPISL